LKLKNNDKRKHNLERNLKALAELVTPDFIKQIETAELPKWLQLIYKDTEKENLLLTQRGRKVTAYPIEDPRAEASALAKNADLGKGTINVIVGGGLGYLMEAMIELQEEGHRIIVIEPTVALIRLTLEKHDLTEEISDKSLVFLPSKDDVLIALNVFGEMPSVQNWAMTVSRFVRDRQEYLELIMLASQSINSLLCNIGTVSGAGYKIADNDMANLPYIIHRRGVRELEGLFKGKPAVVVSLPHTPVAVHPVPFAVCSH
jgi:hypothetical protein